MGVLHASVGNTSTQAPIISELELIFRELPDSELLKELKGPKRRGPKGYDPSILWKAYVVYYYLGLESVSALIRYLQDNPSVAHICGITSPELFPSQPTFSRFGTRLATRKFRTLVRNVSRKLTVRMFEEFPGFGKSVAMDSTPVKAWANGNKKGKVHNRHAHKRGPKPKYGKNADTDAGWHVKTDTHGRKNFTWGFKVHLLCDTQYELPISLDVTAGNVHDSQKATPLLAQARFTYSGFHPRYVIADAAYSSKRLIRTIKRQYRGIPVIDPNARHKKIVKIKDETPDWSAVYSRRQAVERLNARLKGHRKLNYLRVRGRHKVLVHAMLPVAVCQAQALATRSSASVRKVA